MAGTASYAALLPKDVQQFILKVQSGLPNKSGQYIDPQYDWLVTLLVLLALLYMTTGALLRHVKEGVDLERVRTPMSFVRLLYRYYAGFTFLVCAAAYMSDAGKLVVATMVENKSMPPRLLNFWTLNAMLLVIDVNLSVAASVRPVARLVAWLLPSTKRFLVKGGLGLMTELIGDLHALDCIIARLGFMGATWLLAVWGR